MIVKSYVNKLYSSLTFLLSFFRIILIFFQVKEGFPLLIEARDVKVSEAEFNPDFIVKIIPKVKYFQKIV